MAWSAAEVGAQSVLLEKGQHGYMVAGGYTYSSHVHGILLNAGFSYHGEIDLSLGFSRVEAGGLAPVANAIGLGARVFALKQTSEMPISLVLSASYAHASYSSAYLSRRGREVTGTVVAYGLGISRSLPSASSVKIVPAIVVTRAKAKANTRSGFGGPLRTEEEAVTIFTLEVIFGFRDGKRGIIFLNPAVSSDGEIITLNLSAGVIGRIGK